MNKDLIKSIAEEYARHEMGSDASSIDWQREFYIYVKVAEDVLSVLLSRCCIVEKDKVMKEINHLKYGVFFDDMKTTKYIQGREDLLKELFGMSILKEY